MAKQTDIPTTKRTIKARRKPITIHLGLHFLDTSFEDEFFDVVGAERGINKSHLYNQKII